ncbi:MAG: VOC family protein [Verrucomicrobiia bacterium]
MLRTVFLLLFVCSAALVSAIPERVPGLVEPATNEYLSGKVVWADVLSTEPNTTARFYGALFGWTSRTLAGETGKYTILSTSAGPVVGVGRGPDRKDDHPATRWVGYFSNRNLNAAEGAIIQAGGRVLAGPMSVPQRGSQIIAADAEGALFGLMDASAGDPADGKVVEGGLFWANLFSEDPGAAAAFYRTVAGVNARSASGSSHVLAASGADRASISPIDVDTSVTPTWVPFFRVNSMERKLKLAKRLGAKLVIEPRTLSNGSLVAVLADPLGGVFALAEFNEK